MVRQYNIPVPRGELARTPQDVSRIATSMSGSAILKSQILCGGRGKGKFSSGLQGGIQKVASPSEAEKIASQMLGHNLVTKQTGDKGLEVNKIYVAEVIDSQDEWYLAMVIDRENYSAAIILSKSGGIDIESVAKTNPESLLSFNFSLTQGITHDLVSKISTALGTSEKETENLEGILKRMYALFREKDATLLEINPLVRSKEGRFTCLDAKCSFDNAAEFRQKELFAQRDVQQEQGDEVEAEKYGLVYIRLEGKMRSTLYSKAVSKSQFR